MLKAMLALVGVGLVLSACKTSAPMTNHRNLVEKKFLAWQKGTGSPFELLHRKMRWTIIGSTPRSGTYDLEAFKQLVAPFQALLAQPLRPTHWQSYTKGDVVVVHFRAKAMLKSGELYSNEYVWIFQFQGSKVTEVRAFLDLPKFERVIDEQTDAP